MSSVEAQKSGCCSNLMINVEMNYNNLEQQKISYNQCLQRYAVEALGSESTLMGRVNRHSSWVINAWYIGSKTIFSDKKSQNVVSCYVLRPLARLIYGLSTLIIGGLLGTLFHLLAAGYYKCKTYCYNEALNSCLSSTNLSAAADDFKLVFSLALLMGEGAVIANTIDAKHGVVMLTNIAYTPWLFK